jgi:DNA repair ATPase RecN
MSELKIKTDHMDEYRQVMSLLDQIYTILDGVIDQKREFHEAVSDTPNKQEKVGDRMEKVWDLKHNVDSLRDDLKEEISVFRAGDVIG